MIQTKFECCGVENYKNWQNSKKFVEYAKVTDSSFRDDSYLWLNFRKKMQLQLIPSQTVVVSKKQKIADLNTRKKIWFIARDASRKSVSFGSFYFKESTLSVEGLARKWPFWPQDGFLWTRFECCLTSGGKKWPSPSWRLRHHSESVITVVSRKN